MNREIKFRGKSKDIGWVFGQLAYGLNGEIYIIEEVELDNSYGLEETILYPVMWHRVDPETIGQFTGLYDNTKKEIYEGDIVKITEKEKISKHKVIPMKPIIADIEWSEEYLTYTLITTSVKDAFESLTDYLDECDIEVIGNIYDNPELLGGE